MQEVNGSNPLFSTSDSKVHAIYDILYSKKSVKTLKRMFSISQMSKVKFT